MVKINVMKNLIAFNGKPLKEFDTNEQKQKDVTFKDSYLNSLGVFQSKSGKDIMTAYALGQKIYNCEEEELEISDTEHLVLKKAISNLDFYTLIKAQLFKDLGIEE